MMMRGRCPSRRRSSAAPAVPDRRDMPGTSAAADARPGLGLRRFVALSPLAHRQSRRAADNANPGVGGRPQNGPVARPAQPAIVRACADRIVLADKPGQYPYPAGKIFRRVCNVGLVGEDAAMICTVGVGKLQEADAELLKLAPLPERGGCGRPRARSIKFLQP